MLPMLTQLPLLYFHLIQLNPIRERLRVPQQQGWDNNELRKERKVIQVKDGNEQRGMAVCEPWRYIGSMRLCIEDEGSVSRNLPGDKFCGIEEIAIRSHKRQAIFDCGGGKKAVGGILVGKLQLTATNGDFVREWRFRHWMRM